MTSGGFLIQNNDVVTSVAGLNITSVGFLNIFDNDALISLEGLGALESAGAGLSIFDNDVLANLHGLSGLKTVPVGSIGIRNNPVLGSIEGLRGMTFVRDEMLIEGNTALPQCQADNLAAQLQVSCTGAGNEGSAPCT